MPWGLATLTATIREPTVAREELEPGDSILFYTDGVVESRGSGHGTFGIEQLLHLATQLTSGGQEPEEVVRHIVGALLQDQADGRPDDATIVLFHWNG